MRTFLMATLAVAAALGAGVALGWQHHGSPVDHSKILVEALGRLDQRMAALEQSSQLARLQLATRALDAPAPTPQPSPAIGAPPIVETSSEESVESEPAVDPTLAADALLSGHQLLEAAVARGRWTEQDRVRFRGALAGTDGSGMMELQNALVIAINSDQLHPDM